MKSVTASVLAVHRPTGLSSAGAASVRSARGDLPEPTTTQLANHPQHVHCSVRRIARSSRPAVAIGRYLANTPGAAVVECLHRVAVAV